MASSRPYLRALTGLTEEEYDREIARPASRLAVPVFGIWLCAILAFVLVVCAR